MKTPRSKVESPRALTNGELATLIDALRMAASDAMRHIMAVGPWDLMFGTWHGARKRYLALRRKLLAWERAA